MRKLYVLILMITSYHFAFAQSEGTGYVRLEGKQFIDVNGNPFFPMLVNWGPEIIKDGINIYHMSPFHSFGTGNNYECTNQTDCDQQ